MSDQEVKPPIRLLILARKRQQPRPHPTGQLRYRQLREWEDAYREWIEGFDHSFDNGGGAFAAIVDVPTFGTLGNMLDNYPWVEWIDVTARELPGIPDEQRRRWAELNQIKREAIDALRALKRVDYPASIRLYRDLLAQAGDLDPFHPFVAALLASLRHDLGDAGQYTEQASVARRLLEVHEHYVGVDDPVLIINWISLAGALHMDGSINRRKQSIRQAGVYYRKALQVADARLPPDHDSVMSCVHQLGQFYLNQGRYGLAEPLLQRLIALREKRVAQAQNQGEGRSPRNVRHAKSWLVADLGMLERLYEKQRHYGQAEAVSSRQIALVREISEEDFSGMPLRSCQRIT